jgi:peptidoglycan-N-acetylglucosamine deacetylase
MDQTTVALAAAALGALGVATYLSPAVLKRNRLNALRRHIADKRILCLTFDDGPSSTLTPPLLEMLREHNCRATFFMLGLNAHRHPLIVDQVIREGHDVGCHSDQHLNAWKSTPWRAIADIKAGYDRLSPWIRPSGMFRPPYGKMTLATYCAVRRRGAPVWWWTIDSGDTHNVLPSPSQVTGKVQDANGGIVLMHDGSMASRAQERNNFVLDLTEALLDLAQRESLRVVPLSELSI